MAVSVYLTTRWACSESARGSLRVVAAATLAAVACGERHPTAPLPLYTVTTRSGDLQSAPAGAELARPLEVEVRDPDGAPAKGIAVRFRVVAGAGATVGDTLVATDVDGVGRTRLRLGPGSESATVTGAVRGQEGRGVTFRIASTPAPALTGVQPAGFVAGDTVTLRGARLLVTAPDLPEPLFGTVRGRLVGASSDTLLRVVVPHCLPAGVVALTVRVGTVTTNAIAGTATGGTAPLSLAPGEAITVRGTDAACLRLTAEGQRYVLIPQFAVADTSPVVRPYTLALDAISAVPAIAETLMAAPADRPPATRDAFERMLRAAERDRAGDLASGSGTTPGPTARRPMLMQAPTSPPALGSVRDFRVLSRLDGSTFSTASAALRYAGANILLYEDLGSPAPLTPPALASMGALFDRTLYRLDVDAFGSESDIDANGRVIVLMTPIVNALTPASQCSASGFVPGYFYGGDLDARGTNSNRGEIFYAFVPDPRGERSCVHRLDDILSLLPSTFLHEFQHMISFNQHVLVRRGASESIWLNEGLSHIAEELGARYYDTRFPSPTGRASLGQFLPDSALPFLRGNLDDAALYMSAVTTRSVTAFSGFGTLEERGASWLFLRWLGAQKGDGVYARLVQSGARSHANVEAAAGEPFASLFADFAVAMYADSLPGLPRSLVAPRYRVGTRTLRELIARASTRITYPLAVRNAPSTSGTATGTLLPGTAAFFQLVVPRGGVTVRFTGPNGTTLAPDLVSQIGVVRVTR